MITEASEFITRTGSPWISPSWFSQSAGYFFRSERVRESKSLDIRALAAHEVSIKIDIEAIHVSQVPEPRFAWS